MMPAALTNAVYDHTPYAPPIVSTGFEANLIALAWDNVVRVDFARRTASRGEQANVEVHATCDKLQWRQVTSDRLSRLRRLVDGWDGAGSVGMSERAIAKADSILSLVFDGITHPAPPAAVPCADGALQLEWWLTDTRFELSIEADGCLEGWALDRESKHEVSASDGKAVELLRKWAKRLTADKLAATA